MSFSQVRGFPRPPPTPPPRQNFVGDKLGGDTHFRRAPLSITPPLEASAGPFDHFHPPHHNGSGGVEDGAYWPGHPLHHSTCYQRPAPVSNHRHSQSVGWLPVSNVTVMPAELHHQANNSLQWQSCSSQTAFQRHAAPPSVAAPHGVGHHRAFSVPNASVNSQPRCLDIRRTQAELAAMDAHAMRDFFETLQVPLDDGDVSLEEANLGTFDLGTIMWTAPKPLVQALPAHFDAAEFVVTNPQPAVPPSTISMYHTVSNKEDRCKPFRDWDANHFSSISDDPALTPFIDHADAPFISYRDAQDYMNWVSHTLMNSSLRAGTPGSVCSETISETSAPEVITYKRRHSRTSSSVSRVRIRAQSTSPHPQNSTLPATSNSRSSTSSSRASQETPQNDPCLDDLLRQQQAKIDELTANANASLPDLLDTIREDPTGEITPRPNKFSFPSVSSHASSAPVLDDAQEAILASLGVTGPKPSTSVPHPPSRQPTHLLPDWHWPTSQTNTATDIPLDPSAHKHYRTASLDTPDVDMTDLTPRPARFADEPSTAIKRAHKRNRSNAAEDVSAYQYKRSKPGRPH